MTPARATPAPERQPVPDWYRFVVEIPRLKLESLTNGAQFARFQTAKYRKHQHGQLEIFVRRRAAVSPFDPKTTPLRVTITRRAPGTMDSDNAVACAKYVRDWMAKYLGVNDRREDLVEYVVKQEKTKRAAKGEDPLGPYGVVIEVAPKERGR